MPKRKRSTNIVATNVLVPSADCDPPSACQCRVSKSINLVDYLTRVHNEKAYRAKIASRGPLNADDVQLALAEDYLSHSRSSKDLNPKQVRLREGLRRVAVRLNKPYLATFNTKTTSLRTLGKAFWDGCRLAKPEKKAKELNHHQKVDSERVMRILSKVGSEHSSSCVHNNDKLAALLGEIRVRSSSEKDSAKVALHENGICIYRRMVPEDLCCHLLASTGDHVKICGGKGTNLTTTMALGKSGVYFDTNWKLRSLQEKVFEQAGLDGGAGIGILPESNTKAILLAYIEGAENWTHQDDNSRFDYQGLLMLSEPGMDFNGGDLHVLRSEDKDWEKSSVRFLHRGDVAIFRSNGRFFHGMDEVLVGKKGVDGTNRIAVGMFHNLPV